VCRSERVTGTTTVVLVARLNINDFKGINEVFQEFFPVEPPARTTSTVKIFPPGVLVEIDAIALKS